MKWTQIKEKAAGMGIMAGKMKKPDLIRAIQVREGNIACFDTGRLECAELQCCWREDCLPGSKSVRG